MRRLPRSWLVVALVAASRAHAVELEHLGTTLAVGGAVSAHERSPAAAIGVEYGVPGFRWFLGTDSAPLFVPDGFLDSPHVLAITAGPTYGGDLFRIGPYGSLGVIFVTGGLRAVWEPVRLSDRSRLGLEVRHGRLPAYGSQTMLLAHWTAAPS